LARYPDFSRLVEPQLDFLSETLHQLYDQLAWCYGMLWDLPGPGEYSGLSVNPGTEGLAISYADPTGDAASSGAGINRRAAYSAACRHLDRAEQEIRGAASDLARVVGPAYQRQVRSTHRRPLTDAEEIAALAYQRRRRDHGDHWGRG